MAINVKEDEGGLFFLSYRDKAADQAFNAYKQSHSSKVTATPGEGITGTLGAVTVPAESADDKKAKAKSARNVRLNEAGHVIWNLPEIDAVHLAQEGIDASSLQFTYEERSPFVEDMAIGGCRYKTYYKGAYIGVIDVQLSAYSKFNREQDEYFTNVYNGLNTTDWNDAVSGNLFRIAYGEGEKGGDLDLIQMVGRMKFPRFCKQG